MVSGVIAAGADVGGVPARPLNEKGEGPVDLPELVMRILGLASPPGPSDGPEQIAQWDSLGTLRLLLAVEETFGITLGEDEMKAARSVAHLTEVVAAARARASEKLAGV